jgi:predicted alpha-1,2-mannosidase
MRFLPLVKTAAMLCACICLVLAGVAKANEMSPSAEVNPFIGTAEHGHTYPGATVPFGMVQLSPDTGIKGWDWCSGYHWSDKSIIGFSHTHLSGTGCGDLGDVLIAPTVGAIDLDPGTKEDPEKGYRSTFSHANEKASPGYYSVLLKKHGIKAEMSATKHVGIHRYTFPNTDSASIILDLQHAIEAHTTAGEVKIESDRKISGLHRTSGWAKDKYIYFVAEFSRPFIKSGINVDGTDCSMDKLAGSGKSVKTWVTFGKLSEPLVVKVALSTTSVDGAARNLAAEASGWNFDQFHQQARAVWDKSLGKLAVTGGEKKQREIFYTALYHCLLAPTIISDVDGQYRGSDQKVYSSGGFEVYSTFSLWDTFRAEHPLLTIMFPDKVGDMVKSFLVQAEHHPNKVLPIWPLYANETYCMIGYHSFPVIVDAYKKGIRGFDVDAIYKLMLENAKQNDYWAERGYMPADKQKESVSKTLEFAYDDWALSQLAKELGDNANAEKFLHRSMVYQNLFDPETKFMRGKLEDGTWRTPFKPNAATQSGDYTEGDAWQYTFFVPHDLQGLIHLIGGRENFIRKVDELFETPSVIVDGQSHDVSGLIGEYAHGNEPSHHAAYLYSYAGAPNKTQDRVRQIRNSLYDNTPGGLCGNEDCGQMSAWYVLSALGFYPVNPADGNYVFGLPEFPQASIKLTNGKTLRIITHNGSLGGHIGRVSLNGKALDRVFFTNEQLQSGGTLEFWLSKEPSKWGVDASAAPPSVTPH